MSDNDPSIENEDKARPVKRRARTALSCQRCRKHRSKCSRTRPTCEQCTEANVECVYLETPGDLESTALRNRFSGLEDQIHSLLHEFSILEDIVHTPPQTVTHYSPSIATQSLAHWHIQSGAAGLSIDTHESHVQDIYSTLLAFAKDNNDIYHPPQQKDKPALLVRSSLFPNVQLSHFTSLRPDNVPPVLDGDDDEPAPLAPNLVEHLLKLYKTCLLYGAVQPFDALFGSLEAPRSRLCQLLYASIICHMLPHAYYWHREIFGDDMDEAACERTSVAYYKWAKRLLSSLYFDAPSVITCHAICNLVLYHIEYGNTSVVYLYSGMAIRMALSLQLYREEGLASIAATAAFPVPASAATVKQYARSLLWFMYFLDTASSHYHDKPYEIHLDDHVSTYPAQCPADDYQAYFQFIEFHLCQITRDIRRTIYYSDVTSYEEIERIEKRLWRFQQYLMVEPPEMTLWQRRCYYKQWIRHHGHWILIHQSYLPAPVSVQRCTSAAFALVDLFEGWAVSMDCYFRPCVHELKQACEILLYHVDQNTQIKLKALEGLVRLITVLLKTPVSDIARKRPFVQRVLHTIQNHTVFI